MSAAIAAALFPFMASAERIEPTFLYDLPPADVVILGETHDNPVHHAHQAIAIEAIRPAAIVFEMLSAEDAARVTPDLIGSEAALSAVLGWEGSGWPDFSMYYPVFVAARSAEFFGAETPREEVRQAVGAGAAEAFGEEAARFGLDQPLPEPEQMLRESGQLLAHCGAIPGEALPGMVEAQRVRDGWLARAVLYARAATGGPVVVITGNGHARSDWGVPRMLARAAPDLTVLSIGQYEEEAEVDPPYDYWLVTDRAERPDPCAAFR